MEQVLAASKSALIDSLDFSGPPPVAEYVNGGSQSTCFPQGRVAMITHHQGSVKSALLTTRSMDFLT